MPHAPAGAESRRGWRSNHSVGLEARLLVARREVLLVDALARVDLSSDRRPAPRRPEAPDVASARNRPDRPSWNCLKKRYHGPPGSRSWPPPAYPVGSRLPWRKRRRPRRLSVSSWSSSKSRLATTTGRLPLFGRADAVLVQGTVTFNRDRKRIIALAAKHQLPAIYEWRMAAISSSTRWPASPPDNSLFRSGNARALAVRRDCRAADREPVVAGAPA